MMFGSQKGIRTTQPAYCSVEYKTTLIKNKHLRFFELLYPSFTLHRVQNNFFFSDHCCVGNSGRCCLLVAPIEQFKNMDASGIFSPLCIRQMGHMAKMECLFSQSNKV